MTGELPDEAIRMRRAPGVAFVDGATGRPHAGVVNVSRANPNDRPATIAHALAAWRERYAPNAPNGPGSGFLDVV